MKFSHERQQAMAHLVAVRGRLSVKELSEKFDVAAETVRRDLASLERMGLVRRVHGGVLPRSSWPDSGSGVAHRHCENAAAKARIALAAVSLLPPPGSTVILDGGSTISFLVEALPPAHRLTVLTHAVAIAARLARLEQIDLRLLPGRVDLVTRTALGAETVAALKWVRVDAVFLGASAVSPGHGVSGRDVDEAAAKRAMVGSARLVHVLCDATKLGRELPLRYAATSDIDVLVTDSELPTHQHADYLRAGVKVLSP